MPLTAALQLLGHTADIVAHLPPGLLAIAQSPIIRYPNGPNEFAVGNVADVVLARRFVYAAVQHSGSPDQNFHFLQLLVRLGAYQQMREACLDAGTKEGENEYITFLEDMCEELGEFGLLALPLPAYWEQKEEEYRAVEAELAGPAFLCPKCRGAI